MIFEILDSINSYSYSAQFEFFPVMMNLSGCPSLIHKLNYLHLESIYV